MSSRVALALASLALLLPPARSSGAERPVVRLRGSDFDGGAARLFGSTQQGLARTNFIYAEPTGETSRLTAGFVLAVVPEGPLYLHLYGRLDDLNTDCPIRVTLNEMLLLEGPNAFPHAVAWRHLPLPAGCLRAGENRLVIQNTSREGQVGQPPWFLLAVAVIDASPAEPSPRASLEEDFRVVLPAERRPLPEPLPEGREPGFRYRGTKGWLWTPAQYLAEIPVLADYRMNFLMNCYGSMADIEHKRPGEPGFNSWWLPLPESKKAAYEQVVRACRARGIEFCFSLNPNLWSERAVRYDSDDDFAALWQHYEWMQGLGVGWFNLQFDDISQGLDPIGQSRFANRLFAKLRERDPRARFIVCPVYYWGTGEEPGAGEYLAAMARELDPDILVFWTGDAVVTRRITRSAAESYRRVVGHRLFIWDNYPVNDGNPTLHLGPVTGRDADLGEVADGYLANPLHPQNAINRVPLLTMADYAWNPQAYDPARSIGQAILHLAETPAQAETLRDLVELYPGMLVHGQGTGFNPALARLTELLAMPHNAYAARAYIAKAETVLQRLREQFGGRFDDAATTLEGDVDKMREAFRATYG